MTSMPRRVDERAAVGARVLGGPGPLAMWVACGLWHLFPAPVAAQVPVAPNPSFEEGQGAPAGWNRPAAGSWSSQGATGQRALQLRGTVRTEAAWTTEPLAWPANTAFAVSVAFKGTNKGQGGGVVGPTFCRREVGPPSKEWTRSSIYIPAASKPRAAPLELGERSLDGAVSFDDVRIRRVLPLHLRVGDLVLGAGECVVDKRYLFMGPVGGEGAPFSRPFVDGTASFHTDRWRFASKDELHFRYTVGKDLETARVLFEVTGEGRGTLQVATSRDGLAWHDVIALSGRGVFRADVPRAMLPANTVWVRIRASGDAASLELRRIGFEALMTSSSEDLQGATRFAEEVSSTSQTLEILDVGDGTPGGRNAVRVRVSGEAADRITVQVGDLATSVDVPAQRETREVLVPYRLSGPGRHLLRIESSTSTWEVPLEVSELHRVDFGQALASSPDLDLWWAPSAFRIGPTRPTPKASSPAVSLALARDEREAVQVVVRAKKPLVNVVPTVEDLAGQDGTTLSGSSVEVLRVGFVPLLLRGDPPRPGEPWPDPLFPCKEGFSAPSNTNVVLWLRVHAPKEARKGIYRGRLLLKGDGLEAAVPLEIRVFGFALPATPSLESSLAMSLPSLWRFHGVETKDARRRVWDHYLASCRDHRVAPEDPAPLDPLLVQWKKHPAWRDATLATGAHRGRGCLAVEDADPDSVVYATHVRAVPLPPGGLRLSWWHRSEKNAGTSMVALAYKDKKGQRIQGKNTNAPFQSKSRWRKEEFTVKTYPPNARFVELSLWPTSWDAPQETALVWFDDVSLTGTTAREELLDDGIFEGPGLDRLEPVLDATAWDAALQRAHEEFHLGAFRVLAPALAGGPTEFLDGYAPDTAQHPRALEELAKKLQAHLQTHGWLERAYLAEWPFGSSDAEATSIALRNLTAWAPDLRRLLDMGVTSSLLGSVSIWCPKISEFSAKVWSSRQRSPDQGWCSFEPGAPRPWVSPDIDQTGIALRAVSWQCFDARVTGLRVLDTTSWAMPEEAPTLTTNPFVDPTVWSRAPSGSLEPLGPGGAFLWYPPIHGGPNASQAAPIESMRLEMLRDGIEDYEYLVLLRRALDLRPPPPDLKRWARLLEIPKDLVSRFDSYATSPKVLLDHRRRVAEALESLSPR